MHCVCCPHRFPGKRMLISELGIRENLGFAQQRNIRLCCNLWLECKIHLFKHTLLQFDETVAVLDLPATSTHCTLTVSGPCVLALLHRLGSLPTSVPLAGHSILAATDLDLRVEASLRYNFSACSEDGCQCRQGYTGGLNVSSVGSGDDLFGACLPAQCEIPGSNGKAGAHCACKDGYVGDVSWDGSAFYGTCVPASCNIEDSTQQPGPDCRCSDGFHGAIRWQGPIPNGLCAPAQCDIINSNRLPGKRCKCEDKYSGKIRWNRSTSHGTCQPAACNVTGSNRERGPACACTDGFEGRISWKGDNAKGPCRKASCSSILNTEGKGPSCRCRHGFVGDIAWHGAIPRGFCTPLACNVPNSNRQPGAECSCLEGYDGKIDFSGYDVIGNCTPLPCQGKNSNGKRGPECGCADGYTGNRTISVLAGQGHAFVVTCSPAACRAENSSIRIPDTVRNGHRCKCRNGFAGDITWNGSFAQGSCSPAPCYIENSNMKPGSDCRCADGFSGDIKFKGPQPTGVCKPIPCQGLHTNSKMGPECNCEDGYYAVNKTFRDGALHLHCEPAPCGIQNSNRKPGHDCSCQDFYTGKIFWKGSIAIGICHAASCQIENSNFQPGLNCRCADGFSGRISWQDGMITGRCTLVPCLIPNSDYAPGPYCSCARGFYGEITWQEDQNYGACRPMPLCSDSIILSGFYLNQDLMDFQGHTCKVNRLVEAKGFICNPLADVIQWTSVEAKGQDHNGLGTCNLKLPRSEAVFCGQQFGGLPTQCSRHAARPRCSDKITFGVESYHASKYECTQGVTTQGSTRVYFQGQQCGYDLIQWSHASFVNPFCAQNLSFACGEVPEGETLPGTCVASKHEPAIFAMYAWDKYMGFSFFATLKLLDDGTFVIVGDQSLEISWRLRTG